MPPAGSLKGRSNELTLTTPLREFMALSVTLLVILMPGTLIPIAEIVRFCPLISHVKDSVVRRAYQREYLFILLSRRNELTSENPSRVLAFATWKADSLMSIVAPTSPTSCTSGIFIV